jgi:hypothetical protein
MYTGALFSRYGKECLGGNERQFSSKVHFQNGFLIGILGAFSFKILKIL